MKRLRVTVSGPTMSGKSTVVRLLANTLRAYGFHVTEADVDTLSPEWADGQERRLEALREAGLEVEVEAVQVRREWPQ